MNRPHLIEVRDLRKVFGPVVALADVTMHVNEGEVLCLLGDNGAGKSTLIKTLSGVYAPTKGDILVNGERVTLSSPRDAFDLGIATVHQTLALIPLMSIMRNFFMGREPLKYSFGHLDIRKANAVAREELRNIGIDVRDPSEAVGKLSGGERQCVADCAALHQVRSGKGAERDPDHSQCSSCDRGRRPFHGAEPRTDCRHLAKRRNHLAATGKGDVRRPRPAGTVRGTGLSRLRRAL